MNQKIFNQTAEQMAALIFGTSSTGVVPVSTDAGGKPVVSSADTIPIEADDLNIRGLSGAADSVDVYGQSWAQDSDSGTIVGLGSRNFLTKNISLYARNTYLVVNTGSVALGITLQLAPADNDNLYVNDGSAFDLLIGDSHLFEPSRLMKYARIRIAALLLGSATVYYFGQT